MDYAVDTKKYKRVLELTEGTLWQATRFIGYGDMPKLICSKCGMTGSFGADETYEPYIPNYCPNCGTKMR